MFAISVEKDGATLLSDRFGLAVVDFGGGLHTHVRVPMIVVIEPVAETPRGILRKPR